MYLVSGALLQLIELETGANNVDLKKSNSKVKPWAWEIMYVILVINSVAHGRWGCNLKSMIPKPRSRIDILDISSEIALR